MPSDRPRIRVVIEPLGQHHGRAAFCCGNDFIDGQFHRSVVRQQENGVLQVFAAVEPGKTDVLGFYAMRSHEIEAHFVPANWNGLLIEHTLGGLPVPI